MRDGSLKGVLFDFDGVIGNTMEDNFLAWHKVLADAGVGIEREEYFLLEGMKLKGVAEALAAGRAEGVDADAIVKKKDEYYLAHASFSLYPGAEDLLKTLSSAGVPIGLVTAARLERLQATLGDSFLRYFKSVITSEKGGRGKPFPDPYLLGAEELGVPIASCVVLENAPLGIRSAKSAGAYCIAISSTLSKDKLQEADMVIADIRDAQDTDAIRRVLGKS